MMKIHCYKIHYYAFNPNICFSDYAHPFILASECFATEAEAREALKIKKAEFHKEKYNPLEVSLYYDENKYTVEEVEVVL